MKNIIYVLLTIVVCLLISSFSTLQINNKGTLTFQNEWELSLFSGMPSFTKLKFEFSEQKNDFVIKIK